MNNKAYTENLVINDRNSVSITGVISLDAFDEDKIIMSLKDTLLTVEGENLTITALDLDKGLVSAQGLVIAIYYSDNSNFVKKGLFSGLFGKKEK